MFGSSHICIVSPYACMRGCHPWLETYKTESIRQPYTQFTLRGQFWCRPHQALDTRAHIGAIPSARRAHTHMASRGGFCMWCVVTCIHTREWVSCCESVRRLCRHGAAAAGAAARVDAGTQRISRSDTAQEASSPVRGYSTAHELVALAVPCAQHSSRVWYIMQVLSQIKCSRDRPQASCHTTPEKLAYSRKHMLPILGEIQI